MSEEPIKKKRGRPKKVDSFAEFKQEIVDMFSDYVNNHKALLELFVNSEKHLSKAEWLTIQQHVNTVNGELGKTVTEYTYKPDSSWKLIDNLRKDMRKNNIKDIMSLDIDNTLKGWIIFNHLAVYISESSKEMK